MNVSKIPRTVFSLVEPAVNTLASRLFTLSSGRPGSTKFQPTVKSFYETGIVTMLYEHLLMSPVLASYEIRHEMPYPGQAGRPKQVDLWLRPVNGGYPHLIEAGDFGVGKVHRDLAKIGAINSNGGNWFLAFFRDATASCPWLEVQRSFARSNGLDASKVDADDRLARSFKVYRPNGQHDAFGVVLFRGK
ncbi:MAG: hypothetical protein JXA69_11220 [Phycisphaerae bacterium]|nr:hypothetical protein [Phycisphaerae bacterium]